jgi:hypothetical protein
MIPMTFHFGYFRGATGFRWRDIHTLCLQSCLARASPDTIVVHYDMPGEGDDWDEAIDLSGIEWRLVTPPTGINGFPVRDQRIWCDVYRLDVLEKEGGFFCDLDFVFLKSFEELRHNVAVIGTQCSQRKKLACGLMGSVAGSSFITAYKDAYKQWTPADEKTFWTYANCVPWDLSSKHPVTVLKRTAFYPVTWSNKTFWEGKNMAMDGSYAVHLWETLYPHATVPLLLNTCLGDKILSIVDPKPIVNALGGVTVSFD